MLYRKLRHLPTITLFVVISFSLLTYLNVTCFKFQSIAIINSVAGEFSSLSIESTIASYENITTNIGDIVIAGNNSYLIKNCEFNQIGNVIVRENATFIIHNSIFNQTGDDRVGIMLYDRACLIIDGSTIIISQDFDSYIYVRDESTLNVTNSDIINSKFGICIWVEDYNAVYIQNSSMMGGSTGGTQRQCIIMAMNYTIVHVQNTSLDRIVCWNNATIFVQNCTIMESMKTFNYAKAYVSKSIVNYIWVSQNSTFYFHCSIINSSNPLEYAVRAIHQSNVWFKHSIVRGEIHAVDNAKIWLINTSVKKISLFDEASIFVGWELPLLGDLYVPYAMVPMVEFAAIVKIIVVITLIAVFVARKMISRRRRCTLSKQQNAASSIKDITIIPSIQNGEC